MKRPIVTSLIGLTLLFICIQNVGGLMIWSAATCRRFLSAAASERWMKSGDKSPQSKSRPRQTAFAARQAISPQNRGWREFGGNSDNTHYSSLGQINRNNVKQLEVAWSYESGDAFDGSEMQCNPIVIDRVVYATTPRQRVIALDGATGKLLWSFDPNDGQVPRGAIRSRGLMYWEAGSDRRIYVGARNWLIALDAS